MEDPGLKRLFERNRAWAKSMTDRDPDFFTRLVRQQTPDYLWVGCSDARVPANELMGMAPGELFVHRNIANLVHNIDINLMSVLEFAINVLKVRHVIVCGHYGCGGVRAAIERQEYGLIDNWLRKIKDVYAANREALDSEPDPEERLNLLCEINVRQQVLNICHTSIVQNAWREGRELAVHGWIYSLADGLLKDLGFTIENAQSLEPIYHLPGVTREIGF
ncbi:carbonate dehydratase [Dongia deserti]|uniref:carbonate dehydratase n=1 Tax=Dongia deserti TaxID=2268030 RepID=UPI000E65DC97|nr:carbonate dehydratase [Dongia deserti]